MEHFSNAVVLDIETSLAGPDKDPRAYCANAKSVVIAIGLQDARITSREELNPTHIALAYVNKKTGIVDTGELENFLKNNFQSNKVLVVIGHNIKFDLLHLHRDYRAFYNLLCDWPGGALLWDTSIAHYILTGQLAKFPSLDGVSKFLFWASEKSDMLKSYLDRGIMPQEIPREDLLQYLCEDLMLTSRVAQTQVNMAVEAKIPKVKLLLAQMKALRAVVEMEANGMRVDVPTLLNNSVCAKNKVDALEKEIVSVMNSIIPETSVKSFVDSATALQPYLYGGPLSITKREQIGEYKTGLKQGQPRYRNTVVSIDIPRDPGIDKKIKARANSVPTLANGLFSVAEDVLVGLHGQFEDPRRNQLVKLVQERRLYDKLQSTFFTGIAGALVGNCIHPNFNQTATATGRFSSSAPNLQNMPTFEHDVQYSTRVLFISRFKDGALIDVDYKQIEIVALAYRSQDPQLIEDVSNGRDIHTETGKHVFGGATLSKEQRRIVKTINFGLIYGGSAKTLAKQAGCSVRTASECISAFYKRYPRVKEWADKRYGMLRRIIPIPNRITGDGESLVIFAPDVLEDDANDLKRSTGRIFAMERQVGDEVSFTQARNYPIQGFATGDIVPLMMGNLWYFLLSKPKYRGRLLLINQVHDSLLFDCARAILDDALNDLQMFLGTTTKQVASHYGIDFNIPLKVSISVGKNWRETSTE